MRRAVLIRAILLETVLLVTSCGGGLGDPASPSDGATADPAPGADGSTAGKDGGGETAASCAVDAGASANAPHIPTSGGCGPSGIGDDCLADTDCAGTTSFCACGSNVGLFPMGNRCVSSGCRTDADCPSGICSAYSPSCLAVGKDVVAHACHSTADTCLVDSDCASCSVPTGTVPICAYVAEVGHWQCATRYLCVGG